MLSNTTARPRCCISAGVAADGLMIAPRGARLPRSTAMPPLARSGASNGMMTSVCLGGSLTLQTLSPLVQTIGALCPTSGTLKVTVASDGAAQIFYLAGGAVSIDNNLDGLSDQNYESCIATALLTCVQAGTPTVTQVVTSTTTPTPLATNTPPSTNTPSATNTGPLPSSPTRTPTRSVTATASSTPSATVTRTPTPSPTPTKTSGTHLYCDTLHTPLAIPDGVVDIDGNVVGVADTITIPDNLTIRNVRVQLQITHPWVGDLIVFLDHLDTLNYTTLLYNPGKPTLQYGCSYPNVQCTFDDAAGQDADTQCSSTAPAIGGTVRPLDALSIFDGESSAGTWQLEVYDNSTPDAGSLVHWCVEVS